MDSNKEIDRAVERWNKLFKLDCKEFHGKVTEKNISTASNSYQSMEDIVSYFDTSAGIRTPSGKHMKASADEDIFSLSRQFVNNEVFSFKVGRCRKAFPSYTCNILCYIDIRLLKEWILKKLRHFKELNVYSTLSHVCC